MESQTLWQKTSGQLLIALVLLAGVFALCAYGYYVLTQSHMYTSTNISVSGEGEVVAVPDTGQFTFAVTAEGEDAATAQEASAEAMNEVIDYLSDAGVAEADIKTTNYRLNPQYRYEERICTGNSYCPPGERVLDGFEVSQSVEVKVRDTDEAGNLISGVGERGATNISGLTFTVDEPDELLAEARAEAIENARTKATALAEQLGMRVVRVTGFSENRGGYPQPYGMGGDEMAMDVAERSAPSVPTGENTFTSNVNVSFEIR